MSMPNFINRENVVTPKKSPINSTFHGSMSFSKTGKNENSKTPANNSFIPNKTL
jgi:hypothetical protein